MNLYTIGYEGLEPGGLAAVLLDRGVEIVLDVRANPISRRPGFSKGRLSSFLMQNGIEYVHLGELGSPPDARKRLRDTGDFAEFRGQYLRYLEAERDVILSLARTVAERTCCLLCYERVPEVCHRRILAVELSKLDGGSIEVVDL